MTKKKETFQPPISNELVPFYWVEKSNIPKLIYLQSLIKRRVDTTQFNSLAILISNYLKLIEDNTIFAAYKLTDSEKSFSEQTKKAVLEFLNANKRYSFKKVMNVPVYKNEMDEWLGEPIAYQKQVLDPVDHIIDFCLMKLIYALRVNYKTEKVRKREIICLAYQSVNGFFGSNDWDEINPNKIYTLVGVISKTILELHEHGNALPTTPRVYSKYAADILKSGI